VSEKFKALKKELKGHDYLTKFWRADSPLCPHSGVEYSIWDSDSWYVFEEGHHEITCEDCEEDFSVETNVSYAFSTNKQKGLNDE
jgi:hypothetical protein